MIDHRFYTLCPPQTLGDLLAGLAVDDLDTSLLDQHIEIVADLATSQPGQIAFIGSKKYKAQLETAKATACFTPENCASFVSEQDIIPIITKSPRTHFGRVMHRMVSKKTVFDDGAEPEIASDAKVYSSAVICKGAVIGSAAEIHPHAVIGPGVVIGAGTRVQANATVECAVIGKDCTIEACVTIGTRGFGVDTDENGVFDLPHAGRVIIGDRVSMGSQTAVDRGFLGDTRIGNDVKIDNLVQIAHNVSIGDGCMIAAHVGISGSCTVGKNVLMGGSVGLADHVMIGDGARLAASSGVMHDVPSGEMWGGTPAIPLREHMRMLTAMRKLVQKKS